MVIIEDVLRDKLGHIKKQFKEIRKGAYVVDEVFREVDTMVKVSKEDIRIYHLFPFLGIEEG